MELVDKVIKIITVILFHTSKKLEERLTVLSRDMEDIKWPKLNFYR